MGQVENKIVKLYQIFPFPYINHYKFAETENIALRSL